MMDRSVTMQKIIEAKVRTGLQRCNIIKSIGVSEGWANSFLQNFSPTIFLF